MATDMPPNPLSQPLISEHSGDMNLQNLPPDAKPIPIPKGFEGLDVQPMGKGGGTLSQLKNELHIAAFTTDVEKVRQILSSGSVASNKFRVNAIDHECPPLIFAVRVKAPNAEFDAKVAQIARMLIDNGADVNFTLQGEESPLILASIYAGGVGKVQTVRLLLERGADLRQRDKRHRMTALHWAIVSGWHNVVEALVDAGASCTSCGGKEKEDALEMAQSRLLKLKKKQLTPTGPKDEESRRLEFEKMVETLRIGHARRLKEKADKKAERKLAKSAGLAVDDDSVCAESVCDDLDDWEGRGRGTACFTWGDHL